MTATASSRESQGSGAPSRSAPPVVSQGRRNLRPYLLSGDTSSLRFSLANACKDLGYYNTMAGDADSTRAIAAAVLATLEGARKAAPEALVPELATLLAKK